MLEPHSFTYFQKFPNVLFAFCVFWCQRTSSLEYLTTICSGLLRGAFELWTQVQELLRVFFIRSCTFLVKMHMDKSGNLKSLVQVHFWDSTKKTHYILFCLLCNLNLECGEARKWVLECHTSLFYIVKWMMFILFIWWTYDHITELNSSHFGYVLNFILKINGISYNVFSLAFWSYKC